ncbi:MAG TPA: hypothetical protein VLZ50_04725 [Terracidiphilus sp.]|nr:hypothetical protein [Terracidiphilus sp.]
MKNPVLATFLAVTGLLAAAPAIAQSASAEGQGTAVVTVLPKHKGELAPNVNQRDIQSMKVAGKTAQVTSWQAFRNGPVELVILIDEGARSSLGTQINDIQKFVQSLPPNVKAAIAYMSNGQAMFSGTFTTDHGQVLKGLRLPEGLPGVDASPYFCLSDLAKHWPSQDRTVRREVVAITDGVDYYYRRYDPDDPYVQAAITDTVRSGIVVYSIYWKNTGRFDNTLYGNNTGQNLMDEVTQATGGTNFWQGIGNPVSFQPYLEELTRRLNNQYEVSFTAPLSGRPQVENFEFKLQAPGASVDAPKEVIVVPQTSAATQ